MPTHMQTFANIFAYVRHENSIKISNLYLVVLCFAMRLPNLLLPNLDRMYCVFWVEWVRAHLFAGCSRNWLDQTAGQWYEIHFVRICRESIFAHATHFQLIARPVDIDIMRNSAHILRMIVDWFLPMTFCVWCVWVCVFFWVIIIMLTICSLSPPPADVDDNDSPVPGCIRHDSRLPQFSSSSKPHCERTNENSMRSIQCDEMQLPLQIWHLLYEWRFFYPLLVFVPCCLFTSTQRFSTRAFAQQMQNVCRTENERINSPEQKFDQIVNAKWEEKKTPEELFTNQQLLLPLRGFCPGCLCVCAFLLYSLAATTSTRIWYSMCVHVC